MACVKRVENALRVLENAPAGTAFRFREGTSGQGWVWFREFGSWYENYFGWDRSWAYEIDPETALRINPRYADDLVAFASFEEASQFRF